MVETCKNRSYRCEKLRYAWTCWYIFIWIAWCFWWQWTLPIVFVLGIKIHKKLNNLYSSKLYFLYSTHFISKSFANSFKGRQAYLLYCEFREILFTFWVQKNVVIWASSESYKLKWGLNLRKNRWMHFSNEVGHSLEWIWRLLHHQTLWNSWIINFAWKFYLWHV